MKRESEFYLDEDQPLPKISPEKPEELALDVAEVAAKTEANRASVVYITPGLAYSPLEGRKPKPGGGLSHDNLKKVKQELEERTEEVPKGGFQNIDDYDAVLETLEESGLWQIYVWDDENCSCPRDFHVRAPEWSQGEIFFETSTNFENYDSAEKNIELAAEAWKYALDQAEEHESTQTRDTLEFDGWMMGEPEWSFDLERQSVSDIRDSLSESYPIFIEGLGASSDGSIMAGYLHLHEDGGPTIGLGTSAQYVPGVNTSDLDPETFRKLEKADDEIQESFMESLGLERDVPYPSPEITRDLRSVMQVGGADMDERNLENLVKDAELVRNRHYVDRD